MTYDEQRITDLTDIFKTNGLPLLVTATDTETKVIHAQMNSLKNFNGIIKFSKDSNTYYMGILGNYIIVHVQCEMGSVGRNSAIMTVTSAISHIEPKFVLMIGIAFGVDDTKQNIGDVLVSECVIPYEVSRVGKNEIEPRQLSGACSKFLLDKFKNIRSWEYKLPSETLAKKIFTHILSGEKLVDNLDYRNCLTKNFPHSEGGEMEGAGIYAACDEKVAWILVKGICDFADGNKKVGKETKQIIAMNSALNLCMELFNSKYIFDDLNVFSIQVEKLLEHTIDKSIIDDIEDYKDILFDYYDKNCEKYYVERLEDKKIIHEFDEFCIWLYGTSGCGKTTLVSRNLEKCDIKFYLIGLSSYVESPIIDFFKGIYLELVDLVGAKVEDGLSNVSFPELSKRIIATLEMLSKKEKMVIFIEEIPLSDDTVRYTEFVKLFSSLLIAKQTRKDLNNIKFILSTIENPEAHVLACQQKITQKLKFKFLENWTDEDISKLINLLMEELGFSLDDEFRKKLLSTSENSPRFIKKFFQNAYTSRKMENFNCNALLKSTSDELKI